MSRRVYRFLLLAFPRPIRTRHGDDMTQLFVDRLREARLPAGGPRARLRAARLWVDAARDAVTQGVGARVDARRLRRAHLLARGGPPGREAILAGLLYDLRHAARNLRHARTFASVALLSLALGIGASTTIFTLINAVILRPLPVPDPHQLVQLRMEGIGLTTRRFTNPQWESLRDREQLFDGIFGSSDFYPELAGAEDEPRPNGSLVSGAFFTTLGLSPATGRLLEPDDDTRGCRPIAVLGHGYWERRYGADPGIVGRSITLNESPFEVVGVVAPGFGGLMVETDTDLYVPLCADTAIRGVGSILDARTTWTLDVVGRRPADVGIDELTAELPALAAAVLEDSVPLAWGPERQSDYLDGSLALRSAASGFSLLRERYQDALLLLLAAVGVVMLVVCGNLANLMLARAAQRRREIGVRVALGAGGRRLTLQFLGESLLLSICGAALGAVLAAWLTRALVAVISPADRAVALDLAPDLRVLGFTVALVLLTGLLFGLAPAVHALRVDPFAALRGRGSRSDSAPPLLARGGLVAAQVTFSLVLLTGATLLVGTFWHLRTLDPGFDRERVVLVEASLRRTGLTPEERPVVLLQLLDRVRALPGVRAASFAEIAPVSGSYVTEFVVPAGFRSLLDEDAEVFVHRVGDGYFASLGTIVVRGREFTPDDSQGAEPVAIVSETAARVVFGSIDAVGRSFHRRMSDTEVSESFRVVGVVRDAKYRTLRDETLPTVYFARRQQPTRHFGSSMTLHVLPDVPPDAVIPALRALVEEAAPGARASARLLSEQLSASLTPERLLAMVSGFFGGLAFLLAGICLYGVMSFQVSARLGEIGVRMALGATSSGVFGTVLRQAARPVATGLLVGGAASLAAAGAIESLLYGLEPYDVRVLALAAAVLAAVAMASAAIPARRAARLDPAEVLRRETG